MRQIQRSISDCIARAEFVAVTANDVVTTALAAMKQTETSCALVLEDGRLSGIFTERDFLNRVAALRRVPSKTAMADVMTANPVTLQADDCVSYAINLMAEGGYRHVPIVDSNGKPESVLDVRLVMIHLVKVFAEMENDGAEPDDAWIDIGGG